MEDNNPGDSIKQDFKLSDSMGYITLGIEAIIEDEVTQCFEAEDLKVGF